MARKGKGDRTKKAPRRLEFYSSSSSTQAYYIVVCLNKSLLPHLGFFNFIGSLLNNTRVASNRSVDPRYGFVSSSRKHLNGVRR